MTALMCHVKALDLRSSVQAIRRVCVETLPSFLRRQSNDTVRQKRTPDGALVFSQRRELLEEIQEKRVSSGLSPDIRGGSPPGTYHEVLHRAQTGAIDPKETRTPQSYTSSHHHVVFSTKHREPTISPELHPRLQSYIGGILRGRNCTLMTAGCTSDHIHLLIELCKQVSMSDVLRDVKAISSGWVHKTRPGRRGFAWQTGYGAFSVSYANLATVEQYIANQEEYHRTKSFHQEEFVEFLNKHNISYDAKYLLD